MNIKKINYYFLLQSYSQQYEKIQQFFSRITFLKVYNLDKNNQKETCVTITEFL